MSSNDYGRARAVVARAVEEGTSASAWLRLDEYGTWEREASLLLAASAERAAGLGLTAEQVDERIAVELNYRALMAMLRHARGQL